MDVSTISPIAKEKLIHSKKTKYSVKVAGYLKYQDDVLGIIERIDLAEQKVKVESIRNYLAKS